MDYSELTTVTGLVNISTAYLNLNGNDNGYTIDSISIKPLKPSSVIIDALSWIYE